MRTPCIAANWKMYKTTAQTVEFITGFLPGVKSVTDVEIVIAPPFTSLSKAGEMLKGSNVKLSAQDMYFEAEGAYTGEISTGMLIDVGCSYVIVGHSERRQYFNESDEFCNKKIRAAMAAGLSVIYCIGETLQERNDGKTFDVIKREIEGGLKDVAPEKLVIAYEPIWAIGTGVTATPQQAQEAHAYVREQLKGVYGGKADEIRIQYGGSVKPENIAELMTKPDVDGALVGGASLKADSFEKIVKFR
ncbi:MAG: triose-phosphate isomerase [Candidatus Magnetobacterium sp. LHC-1]|uniref:Triosephosphate isomerase n=1 Tax=Candidatus Magnetobacterium casense TaxID=1455061 RepID=A0ABS6RUX2_9BACT|nr:triose-phosphate isomerase [Candidatus Magnetobacterium casensis]MBF0607313.1 triose-phosphate isomerase [Nitrospirota bacterium]MBV6340430.1 triose-phosphate isomerase [Candidatus Magnetobacterium casensis]